MSKEQTLEMLFKSKITAIVRGVEHKDMVPLARALYAGGIRSLEITFDQGSPTGTKDTAKAISAVIRSMGKKMCIGAGTVMTAEQAAAAADAGARFVLAPNVSQPVIEQACLLGLVSIPGALTPTEVATAYEMGADIVKLFPAGDLGLGYIKSIRAPLHHIPMIAVGGVDERNIAEFLAAGLCGVGIGSNIVRKELVQAGDFDALTEVARRYTQAIQ